MSKLFCSLGVGFNSSVYGNIHRKASVLVSLFDKAVGLEAWNFIKKWLRQRCLPVNIEKFLKNGFFYRKPPVAAFISTQKGKEKESVEQKEKKFFKWKKKKLKHFSWLLAASFGTSYNRIANTTISIPKLTLFLF